MNIDYTKPLIDFAGDEILNEKGEALTFKSLGISAAKSVVPGDEALPIADKTAIGLTARAMSKGLPISLEDAKKMQERIARIWPSPSLTLAISDLLSTEVVDGSKKKDKAADAKPEAPKAVAAKTGKGKGGKVADAAPEPAEV